MLIWGGQNHGQDGKYKLCRGNGVGCYVRLQVLKKIISPCGPWQWSQGGRICRRCKRTSDLRSRDPRHNLPCQGRVGMEHCCWEKVDLLRARVAPHHLVM